MKYILNFEGSLGEYIRLMRKSQKINSIDLSRKIGKSDSYISHIENRRYKTPDYTTLFEVFRMLGINEERIEDYLYHFNILSPEREAFEEAQMIASMEQEDFDNMEKEAAYRMKVEEDELLEKEIQNRFNITPPSRVNDEESDLVYDMLNAHVVEINRIFANMIDHDTSNAFDFILGLSKTLDSVSTNLGLYKFMIKFFSEKIDNLDSEGLVNVLNTLYDELNKDDVKRTAFGKPRLRKSISEL